MAESTGRAAIDFTGRLEEFLGALSLLRDERRDINGQRLGGFLEEFRTIRRETASPDAFNLLDVLGVGDDEVKHSSILAWLINPASRHGFGTRFLAAFLDAASIKVDEAWLERCRVYTEFSGQESVVDIMVTCPPNFVLYVENKTVSLEGEDQLAREHRDLLRLARALRVTDERAYGIFLTPGGRTPRTGDLQFWRPLSYGSLASHLEQVVPMAMTTKLAAFVADLIETYRGWSPT